ncbi:hypothetical protein [Cumulibacter manganitolerans]|uniref:hypothetical protein n=1 Tax=Cumulibacter manganitolerans TaxID=1884992 RepID=UPI001295E558|nr:hypothetical protein [Cumulibacter manganitolerans]
MRDRLLPLWAAVLGLCVAFAVFVPLHLVLDAGAGRTTVVLAVGAAVIAGLLWYLRRAEVLRTTQAQGYFTAALMIVAIALVMLPPGYLVGTLLG